MNIKNIHIKKILLTIRDNTIKTRHKRNKNLSLHFPHPNDSIFVPLGEIASDGIMSCSILLTMSTIAARFSLIIFKTKLWNENLSSLIFKVTFVFAIVTNILINNDI